MKKLFSIAAALLFGLSAMATETASGTYSVRTLDDATSTWDFGAKTTGSSQKIPNSTTDNGIYFVSASNGDQQLASSGGLSNKAASALYLPVISNASAGTITMTTFSTSDSRWLQLFVGEEAADEAKRLWSKPAATASDGKKGPQSFAFTASDLTELNGVYYLQFRSNNTEMKIATLSITLTNGDVYESGVTKYTVSYYDGANLLGTERVEEGAYATTASTYETKARHTFDGWFNDAALTSAANVATTAITADKPFYGKWTAEPVTYSSSLNIEQGVLDNSKAWDIEGAFAAAHIGYANINALDSLNSSSTANNEPFLGLKLKTAGAYVEVGLHAGDVLRVKFGNVADDIKVNGATVAKANLSAPYEHTAAADEYVRFETTTKNTVVLKQIMINEAIAAVALPGNETNTKLATLTLDGTAIEGFSSSKTTYDITLPEETTTAPVVAATAEGVGAVVGEITQATAIPGSATFTVTAANGTTTATYTINFSHLRGGKELTNVKFSNGAYGAIDETTHTVTVAYMGTMPTVEESSVVVSEGASAAFAAEAITVTAEDGTAQAYAIEGHALVASAALDTEITFDGTEAYVYAHYGWDAEKGIKFAKKVDDASNMRIAKGNTRIYMALPAAAEVDLTSGKGGARDVKIFVNGVESSVTKTAAANSAITISLSQSGDNFVMIDSNQDGGDGGFIKMFVRSQVATGMEEIATEKAVKFIENGQLYILKNGVRYNALGAVVE